MPRNFTHGLPVRQTIMFGPVPPLSFLPLMIGPLGMQEMLIILMVALIVFGPRKLPQIGKTLGKSIAEFRRTSTELRSTLEREVQMEEFRAARGEVSSLKKDVLDLGRGLDPDAGSDPAAAKAPEGESAPATGPEDESSSAATASEAPTNGSSVSGSAAGVVEDSVHPEGAADADSDSAPESTPDSGK